MPWIKVLPFIAQPSNRSPFGYCINGCRRSADIDEFNSNQQQQFREQAISYNNVSEITIFSLYPQNKHQQILRSLQLQQMQQLSSSNYNVSVKQEDQILEQSSSPHQKQRSNGQLILVEQGDSDQLNFYRNKCKRKKKRIEILDLNIGKWSPQQKKSFHLLLEVSFRTFINRMVFKKKYFKLFARRKQFFTMRSHSQTRTFLEKLQRRHKKNFIQILIDYRRMFYNSLDPQHVESELRRRSISSERILTIQQLQKLFSQTKELKKYVMDVKTQQINIQQAMIKATNLKQQQQRRQQQEKQKQIERQKQVQEMKELMERYDHKNKKSKQDEYIPKKSKIMCFTMDPLTFQIINQKQIEE